MKSGLNTKGSFNNVKTQINGGLTVASLTRSSIVDVMQVVYDEDVFDHVRTPRHEVRGP